MSNYYKSSCCGAPAHIKSLAANAGICTQCQGWCELEAEIDNLSE